MCDWLNSFCLIWLNFAYRDIFVYAQAKSICVRMTKSLIDDLALLTSVAGFCFQPHMLLYIPWCRISSARITLTQLLYIDNSTRPTYSDFSNPHENAQPVGVATFGIEFIAVEIQIVLLHPVAKQVQNLNKGLETRP